MESSNNKRDSSLDQLESFTQSMETHIDNFEIVGEGVEGHVTTGFTFNREEE